MNHDVTAVDAEDGAALGTLRSFAFASMLVMVGVVCSWIFLKQSQRAEEIALPQVPLFAWSAV